jgi:hypothetical protein
MPGAQQMLKKYTTMIRAQQHSTKQTWKGFSFLYKNMHVYCTHSGRTKPWVCLPAPGPQEKKKKSRLG